MDRDALALFLDVAHAGSFAAAARTRAVDPSAVSRTVAALEAGLGVRLFHRTTRRLSLTDAGERFRHRIAPLLTELDAAEAEARDGAATPRGTVRVAASTAFGATVLVPVLASFLPAHPEVNVDLALSDTPADLAAERIDLAVRHGPRPTGAGVARRLLTPRYHVCASPAFLAGAGRPEAPARIAAHRCLTFALPDYRASWHFTAAGVTEVVPLARPTVISSALALREAARAGLGLTLLADWLVRDDLASGRLVDVFPAHTVTATAETPAVWLVRPSRAHAPASVRAFADHLARALGKGRAGP